MKKKFCLIGFVLFILFAVRVQAIEITPNGISRDEIPDGAFIIGSHLFSPELEDEYNSTIYGNGLVTAQLLMLGSSSIDTEEYDSQADFVVYNKIVGDLDWWMDNLTGQDIDISNVPEYFQITHINGVCIVVGGCGTHLESNVVSFYDYDGTTLIDSKPVAYGKNVAASDLPSADRTGYKFVCWSTSASTKNCDSLNNIIDDKNVYAYYEPIEYSVKYVTDSGILGPYTCSKANTDQNECSFRLGDNIPSSRVGYKFVGWAPKLDVDGTDNNQAYLYQPGDSVTSIFTDAYEQLDSTIIFYPVYEPLPYNVSYTLNGGSISGDNPVIKSQYTVEDSVITLPTLTKEGYKFNGWKSDRVLNNQLITAGSIDLENPSGASGGGGLYTDPFINDVTFVADFTEKGLKVYFDKKGGEGQANNITNGKYTTGFTAPVLTKEHSTFLGWNGDDGKFYAPGQSYTNVLGLGQNNELHLTAMFSGDAVHTITYKLADGHFVNNAVPVTMVYDNGNLPNIVNAEKEGYKFEGWYTAETGGTKITSLTNVRQDQTLYAHWTEKGLKVYFNKNGGVGTANDITNGKYTTGFTAPVLTKEHSTFLGWIGDDGRFYNSGQVYHNVLGIGNNNELHLTALFSGIDTYTITYNLDGGHFVNNAVPVTMVYKGESLSSIVDAEKEGYTFEGWYSQPNGQGTHYTSITNINSDKVLYAYFSLRYTSIEYDVNGGYGVDNPTTFTNTIAYNQALVLPQMRKDNTTFLGWNGNNGRFYTAGTHTHVLGANNTNNLTLTAVYSGNDIHTIDYNLNGGRWQDGDTPVSRIFEGETLSELLEPVKPLNGWNDAHFVGWSTDPQGNNIVTSITGGTTNIMLYAQWQ